MTLKNAQNDNRYKGNSNNKKNDNLSTHKGGEVNLLEVPRKSFQRNFRRTFTPIGMSYAIAFDRLNSKGALFPIGPTPDPEESKKSPCSDKNAYCKYHKGNGHKTEDCYQQKHVIQDVVGEGRL